MFGALLVPKNQLYIKSKQIFNHNNIFIFFHIPAPEEEGREETKWPSWATRTHSLRSPGVACSTRDVKNEGEGSEEIKMERVHVRMKVSEAACDAWSIKFF